MTGYAEMPNNIQFENLTSMRFGIVTVTGYLGKQGIQAYWEYLCDCGKIGRTSSTNMKLKKSCGCQQRLNMSLRQTTHGETKGNRRSTEYVIWADMVDRCTNPKNAAFASYGGRGIRVCKRWLDGVQNFVADMGRRPSSGVCLDRINNDGNYEPRNCRWATQTQQHRNRTGCHWVRWDDEIITVQEACDRVNLADVTVHARLRRGWSMHDALTTPSAKSGVGGSLSPVAIEDLGVERRPAAAIINQSLAVAGRLKDRTQA